MLFRVCTVFVVDARSRRAIGRYRLLRLGGGGATPLAPEDVRCLGCLQGHATGCRTVSRMHGALMTLRLATGASTAFEAAAAMDRVSSFSNLRSGVSVIGLLGRHCSTSLLRVNGVGTTFEVLGVGFS
jgi:hypothetical protein